MIELVLLLNKNDRRGKSERPRRGTAGLPSSFVDYRLSNLAKAEGMGENNCGLCQQSSGF